MYTLYYMPGAASFVVHWLLLEIGATHELRRIDGERREHKQASYLALNPNGLVPVLICDGRPVYEAAAIAMLLAERHPQAGLAPPAGAPARVPYLQWMLHLANTLQPAFRNWFYPDEAAGPEHVAVVQERARGRIEAAFDRLEAHLSRPKGPGSRAGVQRQWTSMLRCSRAGHATCRARRPPGRRSACSWPRSRPGRRSGC